MYWRLMMGFILVGLLAACSSDDDKDNGDPPPPGNTTSGMAVKGPFTGGTVTAFEVSGTGTVGTQLGTGTVDASGQFSVDVGTYVGPMLLRVSGGSFMDEATGATSQNAELYSFTTAVTGTNSANITPLTGIVALRALQRASQGMDLADAVAETEMKVSAWFGIQNIFSTVPANLADGPVATVDNAAEYGAILAGISRLAMDLGVGADDLAAALAADAEDGAFDGEQDGTPITVVTVPLPADAAQAALATAIDDFLGSAANTSGLVAADFADLTDRLASRPDPLRFVAAIAVSPVSQTVAAGTILNFTATGTYSDGDVENITATATWDSSDTSVATIAAGGTATAGSTPGQTIISATQDGTVGSTTLNVTAATLVSIEVTPVNPSLFVNGTQQFTATGTYSDSSVNDITSIVQWSSNNAAVLTIDSNGLATAVSAGTAMVTATDTATSISDSTDVDVQAVVLVSIDVTPANPVLYAGNTQQFTATGTFNDSSTANVTGSVNWQSSATGSLSINANGLATVLATGTPTITATDPATTVDGSTGTTVHGLTSIAVTPANETRYISQTQQFTATATYSDTTTANITSSVTWSSSAASVMSISAGGLGTAQSAGTSQITATEPVTSVSGNTGVTVFISYANNIQPIFTANCAGCHPPEQGLDLTSYQGLMAGGNGGPAVIVNDANNSLLVRMIEGTVPGRPQMPDGGPPLPQTQIDMIRAWINAGALNN
jgi:hypothetical protein